MKQKAIIAQCRSGHNFIKNQIESWTGINPVNLEDAKPINCHNLTNSINVIVVRDLLNWFASYLKWITKDGLDSPLCTEIKLNNAFSIWNDITKEAFRVTNYIPSKMRITYDIFKESKPYRELICKHIGGNYNESRLNEVVSAGGGSSFDYQNLPGTELKSDLRYKQIMDSDLKDLYLRILRNNKESIDLYTEYFELTEEQLKLINNGSI